MAWLRTLFGGEGDILEDRQFQLLLSAIFPLAFGTALFSPILETLTGPYGVSSTTVGQLIAAYSAPGIVLIPITGILADRIGRKPLIVFGLMLFGIAGTAIAFTTEFRVALGLRFLQGVGWAALAPMVITALGDLYEGDREATAQGIQFTVAGVSQTVVPPIAGVLVVIAWQLPLLLYAVSIPAALGLWRWFDEPASFGVAADGGEREQSGADRGQVRRLLRLVSRPRVSAVILARQVPTITWFVLVTYASILAVQVLGGTPGIAGVIVAAASVAKAIGSAQVGRATAFFDRRLDLLVVATLVLGGGLVLSGFASSFFLLGVGFVVTGVSQGMTMSLYQSVITGFAPESLRGGLVSVSETVGRVTATGTPLTLGAAVLVLTPTLGNTPAIRWTVAGSGIVLGLGGAALLIVAWFAPAVSTDATLD